MDNKGQAVFSEYVMIFFVVLAVAMAMAIFVQRSFEARIHDARNYMIDAVNSKNVIDDNFIMAAGGWIPSEYEPYYEQFCSTVENYQNDVLGIMPGNAQVMGVIYKKVYNGAANSSAMSIQLPAMCSGANPPPCCFDGTRCTTCICPSGHYCGPDTCGNLPEQGGACHSCGDPNSFGCNSSFQCYSCACPSYTIWVIASCWTPATPYCTHNVQYTYTAICGPDTCGNPNGCTAITHNTCSGPGDYCSPIGGCTAGCASYAPGVCYTPSSGDMACCFGANKDGGSCTGYDWACGYNSSSNYNPP